jgi:lactobin A/cerein 7B family class IIb bacteriocin
MQQPQTQNVPAFNDKAESSAIVVLDDRELAQVSGGAGPNGGWSAVCVGPNGGW